MLAVEQRSLSPLRSPWLHARPYVQILLVSVVLRVVAAVILGDVVVPRPGIYDERSYDALAMRVIQGHGFSFATDSWPMTRAGEPTAHWSYLYTLFLSAIYAVAGHHPIIARLIQAVSAGVLMPVLMHGLGRRVLGPRVGRYAAALGAVYAYFIYYGAALMTETYTILALLAMLSVVTDLDAADDARSRRMQWAAFGLLIAIAAYLRQVTLIVVPMFALWLLMRRPRMATVRGLALAGTVAIVLITPATLRNYAAFGRFVLLNTNAGYAFFWSNHPVQGTDFESILSEERGSYQDLVPQEIRDLDEAALEQALMQRGIGFVLADPKRYALLSFSRLKDYFQFWPSEKSSLPSNLSRVLSFGLALPFMLVGLLRSRRHWRRCMPLYLFSGTYVVVHLLSWSLIRYRLPVDAVMLIFAGSALCDLEIRWRRRRNRPEVLARSNASGATGRRIEEPT